MNTSWTHCISRSQTEQPCTKAAFEHQSVRWSRSGQRMGPPKCQKSRPKMQDSETHRERRKKHCLLLLTPHRRTRSGPQRPLWWAAASCWSHGPCAGRTERGPLRCGWPGRAAELGPAALSSRPRSSRTECTAADRTLQTWRHTAGPGPGSSLQPSTARSAPRYDPRPGRVSERT